MTQFTATMEFNKIFVIESLEDNELKTGTDLYNNTLVPFSKSGKIQTELYPVTTKDELIQRLNVIDSECKRGIKPIIHFEIHGSTDKDGLVLYPSNDFFSWSEFTLFLRKINDSCDNNLAVIMAVCYGFHSIMKVSIVDITPYYLLIGPQEAISNLYILKVFPQFYESLINTLDVNSALKLIEEKYKMYLCEEIFANTLIKYFREKCVGKGKEERINELIQKLREHEKFRDSSNNIDKAKTILTGEITPNINVFNKYKNSFLLADRENNKSRFQINFDTFINDLDVEN